jgi:hypothetical protein
MWKCEWLAAEMSQRPITIMAALQQCLPLKYPQINKVFRHLITLPVTSCSAERSFSLLKRLKTTLRSSMGQTRLTGLALLSIHRNIPMDEDVIINKFMTLNKRHMEVSKLCTE